MATANKAAAQLNKYKVSRRGRKLQVSDDQRTLMSLPKDVPERTWAEILQKEENDLLIFDIREEIVEEAMNIVYEQYMDRQNIAFTVYCAAEAWLKLIDWHFYRHDPGEEPSALPLCYIPKRAESWTPDELPQPSPKDTWGKQDLDIIEGAPEVPFCRWPSSDSLDYPVVEDIPEEYWFPGKVVKEKPMEEVEVEVLVEDKESSVHQRRKKHPKKEKEKKRPPSDYDFIESFSGSDSPPAEEIGVESEVLQKVTDYSKEMSRDSTASSKLRPLASVEGSIHGAGDSLVDLQPAKTKRASIKRFDKSKTYFSKSRSRQLGIDVSSGSRLSVISDCRLRNLRLETHFEVGSEKMSSPLPEIGKTGRK